MLVCSCNLIDHNSIESEVDRHLADDPAALPSAPRIYMRLGSRPRCGGCLPLAVEIINGRAETVRRCQCEMAETALAAAG